MGNDAFLGSLLSGITIKLLYTIEDNRIYIDSEEMANDFNNQMKLINKKVNRINLEDKANENL